MAGKPNRSSPDLGVQASPNSSVQPRGRYAHAPTDIPPKGWRDVLQRVFHGISEDRITTISGGVTFFVLLALFPGLAGLISLYGLFADSSTIAQHLNSLEGILPEGGMQILRDQLQQLTSQPPQKLGLATIASLAVSLWSANGGIKAMFEGLNAVYEEDEKRSFTKLNAISLALTLGGLAFVILSLLTITVVPNVLSFLGLPALSEIVNIARWPVLLVVASLMNRGDLPLWSKPGSATMALDITGQHLRRGDLDNGFTALLVVHRSFRKLQQNLRIARSGRRLHDLDLDIDHGHPGRSKDQRRTRTSDRDRHHGWNSGASRQARRSNGRYSWAKLFIGLRPVLAGCSLKETARALFACVQ
jgi:hypothetical protein